MPAAQRVADRLGVGFIGSGFNARFHMQAFVGVRDADVHRRLEPEPGRMPRRPRSWPDGSTSGPPRPTGRSRRWSPTPPSMRSGSAGRTTPGSRMSRRSSTPSKRGQGELIGVACEKPLARNVAEAKQVLRAGEAGGATARLPGEPGLRARRSCTGATLIWARGAAPTGRPYLARAAEEHSGPHMPWFWQGKLQGGGVLNDMMCHSVAAGALSPHPARDAALLAPAAAGHRPHRQPQVDPAGVREAPRRRAMGNEVDYAASPAEDFASVTIEFDRRRRHQR